MSQQAGRARLLTLVTSGPRAPQLADHNVQRPHATPPSQGMHPNACLG